MTALQELANLKGELERIKAESDLNAQAFTDAQNALASVTATRDSLAAEKGALVSERDALAVKVAALEKASHDFTASVETRAASLAVEQLAAVGVAPVKADGTAGPVTDFAALLAAETDPVKRTQLFRQHAKNIRKQANAVRSQR